MVRRVPKGKSTGGQFAPDLRGKHDIPTPAGLPTRSVSPERDTSGEGAAKTPLGVKIEASPEAVRYRDSRGLLHHPKQPAVIPSHPSHPREWWLHGKKHRVDGPAVEHADGGYEWWHKGVMHREDGPAAHYADGSQKWLFHGKRHRLDGPAIINADGSTEWWVNGEHVTTQEDFEKAAKEFFRHHGGGWLAWRRRRQANKRRNIFPHSPMPSAPSSGDKKAAPAKPDAGPLWP